MVDFGLVVTIGLAIVGALVRVVWVTSQMNAKLKALDQKVTKQAKDIASHWERFEGDGNRLAKLEVRVEILEKRLGDRY